MKDNSLDGHRGKVAIGDSGINKQTADRGGKTIGTSNSTRSSSSTVNRVVSGGNAAATAVGSAASLPSASSEVASPAAGAPGATNFDDDYNEWELGIGDLIIDLDADIEKNNEKNGGGATQNGSLGPNALGGVGGGAACLPSTGSAQGASARLPVSGPAASTSPTATENSSGAAVNDSSSNAGGLSCSLTATGQTNLTSSDRATMSNSKSSRLSGGIGSNVNATNGGGSNNVANVSGGNPAGALATANSAAAAAVEHQATVDKGLKMKIKRKNVGSKSSEAKHEIVQSDTSKTTPSLGSHHQNVEGAGPLNAAVLNSTSTSTPSNATAAIGVNATSPVASTEPKSKHSSGKGRGGSHRDKKEKSRDKEKDKNKSAPANSVIGASGANPMDANGVSGNTSNCNLPSGGGAPASGTGTTVVKMNAGGLPLPNSSNALANLSSQQPNAGASCLATLAQHNGANASVAGASATGIVISGAQPLGASASSNVNHQEQIVGVSVGVTNCGVGVSGLNGPSSAMPSGNVVSSIPNLTVKLEKYGSPASSAAGLGVPVGGGANVTCPSTNCSVISKNDELPKSPPVKRMKIERVDRVDGVCSPIPPETQETGTCTSIGTVTEPECLGPCEPGTSVLLEGIVWQETEGAGVLVVNVTWRGKTYVGTLLDCTKHDWAPPRLCESPISDMDTKTAKGRGKRGRGSANNNTENNFAETRTAVQSKLRNGKGRRNGSNTGFTVPNSPARSNASGVAESAGKRKGRPADLELSPTSSGNDALKGGSKRSRTQSRNAPGTPGNNGANSVDFSQPSSPTLIECPEPNCSKKYKHINGLRYHQTHAHSGNQESAPRPTEEPPAASVSAPEEGDKDATALTNPEGEEAAGRTPTATAPNSSSVPPSPNQPGTPTTFGNTASPKAATNNALRCNAQQRVTEAIGNANGAPSTPVKELPENFEMNSDLSTLASVAISDSAASNSSRFPSNSAIASSVPAAPISVESKSSAPLESGSVLPPATTGTVIQRAVSPAVIVSAGSSSVTPTPSVTVSIPTSHVMSFAGQLPPNVGNPGASVATGQPNNNAYNSHSSSGIPVQGVYPIPSTNVTPDNHPFPPGSSGGVPNAPGTSHNPNSHPGSSALNLDKNKGKQEKMDRYKSQKLPSTNVPPGGSLGPIRPTSSSNVPITGGSPAIQAIAANVVASSHVPGMNPSVANHPTSGTASLKPIQPKPTILGEPTTVNPALESLKREKSKHKKKCKDKDKKNMTPSAAPKMTGMGLAQNEGGDRIDNLSAYHSEGLRNSMTARDSMGNLTVTGPNSQQGSVPGLCNMGGGTPSRSLDLTIDPNTPESAMNENVQSPAYSDISDANDTAPVLESEVAVSEKEKDDKTLKTTSEAAPSPSGNIAQYGMYYYGQPPYLIPSVPARNSSPTPAEKLKETPGKKPETDRVKDPSKIAWGSIDMTMDSRSIDPQESQNNKKTSSRDEIPNPTAVVPPPPGLPDYQHQQHQHQQQQQQQQQQSTRQSPLQQVQQPSLQQSYPYPYGYMQGFPYGMDPNFHVHMLAEPHYKQQQERLMHEQERLYKEQQHQQHHQQQQNERRANHAAHAAAKEEERNQDGRSSSGRHSDVKRPTPPSSHYNRERDSSRESSQNPAGGMMMSNHVKRETPPASNYSSSSQAAAQAASLKEKQSENHQIMKENIELKSQMDSAKAKYSHYETNVMMEKHREEIRRYYLLQDHYMEQQQPQQKMDEGSVYHHSSHPSSRKDENPHYPSKHGSVIDARGQPCVSPHKSADHHSKNVHGSGMGSKSGGSSASAGFRDSHHSSKDHGKNKESSSSKNDSHHDSGKDDSKSKSGDKNKSSSSSHSEGQKPTMETTGPPPPPTNSYAYLHASYLQPPPHFAHMPFDPTHPVYRGGLNPILMSAAGPAAAYGGSPYFNPQLRYHVPHGPPPPVPCDLPPPQPPGGPVDPHHHHSGSKMHPSSTGPPGNGPPGGTKALDLLHQVSQHYTTHSTHKIHELQERALMSPATTPNSISGSTPGERRDSRDSSGPGSNPTPASPSSGATAGTGPNAGNASSTHGGGGKGATNADNGAPNAKQDCTNASGDRSRSPPPQRHLHTHHHTHVGVGYPIYDPYGAVIASQQAAAAVVAAGHSFVPK